MRTRRQTLLDFISFPLRAVTLIETNRWNLSSLASERFDYVAKHVKGYCLDVGCGKHNRFIQEYLNGHGRGIDLFPYEGLTAEHIVADMTHFPFADSTFDSVTFIANINHVPKSLRDTELTEAYRCLKPGGNIIVTMGNPLAELLIHKVLHWYDTFLGTNYDVDGERGMHEEENFYLTNSEINARLIRAGFTSVAKKYFLTQWGFNHLFIGNKTQTIA